MKDEQQQSVFIPHIKDEHSLHSKISNLNLKIDMNSIEEMRQSSGSPSLNDSKKISTKSLYTQQPSKTKHTREPSNESTASLTESDRESMGFPMTPNMYSPMSFFYPNNFGDFGQCPTFRNLSNTFQSTNSEGSHHLRNIRNYYEGCEEFVKSQTKDYDKYQCTKNFVRKEQFFGCYQNKDAFCEANAFGFYKPKGCSPFKEQDINNCKPFTPKKEMIKNLFPEDKNETTQKNSEKSEEQKKTDKNFFYGYFPYDPNNIYLIQKSGNLKSLSLIPIVNNMNNVPRTQVQNNEKPEKSPKASETDSQPEGKKFGFCPVFITQIRENDFIPKLVKRKSRPFYERSGDWICNECKNLNFAFRTCCNRCRKPKGKAQEINLDDDKNTNVFYSNRRAHQNVVQN